MKTIEMTDRAAEMITALRDEEWLNRRKAGICDVMSSIIQQAYENIGEQGFNDYLPEFVELSEAVELMNELGAEPR